MRLPLAAFALVLVAFVAHSQPRDPADVIAVVLGHEITVEEARGSGIAALINGSLIENFAEDNGIRPTEDELTAFTARMLETQRRSLSRFEVDRAKLEQALEETLSAEERKEIQDRLESLVAIIDSLAESQRYADMDVVRPVAMRWVKSWKVNKALYEKYGGRVIWQQAGFEPLDAQRQFLEEQQASGAFTIFDQDYEDEFWHYWRTERIHKFVPEGKERELINTPWWLMEEPTDY